LAKTLEERRRVLAEWRRVAREAAAVVKELYPEARVYLAGSLAEGEAIAGSDIDLVVVLPREPSAREAARIIALIWDRLGLPLAHPLEVHVVSEEELQRYKRMGKLVELA